MTEQVNPAPRLDNQDPGLFGQTPSQTVGPFFHYSLPWKGGADLVGQSDMGARPELFPEDHDVLNLSPPRGAIRGETIILEGVVCDADGKPVPDAMIEIWQANAAGRYASPDDDRTDIPLDEGFIGFGRAATSEEGFYRFRTVLPGAVPGPGDSLQAPHIAVGVFARGVLKRLATRVYFAGQDANATDPILALVPAERRHTLIAREAPDKDGGVWRFDIVLQGEGETVFFDI
ncbi:protocatechuate 3,4-dioxygenase, alpha subunit [Caulobacter sp. AP07]|uniref:protocatechuate 3,4-dioxygenase subunit alpha n=1 Tax=Caulobacter sp. AP07 TaxID=1144304 RepID=UPI000271EDEF|nr:protocatechuate 3,4-dioxygenase subunit alpha [Caulobacter sp. AP07]EJL30823.1 protocatechuate 3,4-dioxygenase, alpha subunit [Caulobacter sp. AP07]